MRLAEASEQYISTRRSAGSTFESGTRTLRAFSKFTGDSALNDLHADHVLCFLNRRVTTNITWRLKYWVLHRFFDYWCRRGKVPWLVMPAPKPKVGQTFIPYIYTQLDLRLLLKASAHDERSSLSIAPLCSSAMLVFLYATGVGVGETSRMMLSDIDLDGCSITISNARSRRHRTLPLGVDLVRYLRPYILWRSNLDCPNRSLFVTKSGVTVSAEKFGRTFSRLRRIAALCRRDDTGYRPRVEDLRHTFAVHRIDKWVREGADLNRMLPALAAYMGQNGLGATNRYLFMTPERFRKDLDKLSPMRGSGDWCDDIELMEYVSDL